MKPVQLILLGGAGYLLYRHFTQPARAAQIVTSVPPGSVTSVPPSSPAAATPAPPIPETSVLPDIALLIKAAASKDPSDWEAVKSVLLSSDTWNFYWGQGNQGTAIPSVDLFDPGRRSDGITVADFHARRHAHGLEGLRGLGVYALAPGRV